MNGAESLVRTLLAQGVDTCFTNPGTSEMHFVAALDRIEGMRCVLGLFEGVVTGAADAYYRMARKPASTLLHLGPGLANGLANLHNARKAHSGIVNIVGEHALPHLALNAPLTSDIEGVARPMSDWVRTARSAAEVASIAQDAVHAARRPPGQVATLVLPADCAWGEVPDTALAGQASMAHRRPTVDPDIVAAAARILASPEPTLLLAGGVACFAEPLKAAGRIAAKTGCAVMTEFYVPRLERGAGRVNVPRVPYAVDAAVAALARFRNILLVGASDPVSFFAYPGKPGRQAAPGCHVMQVAGAGDDLEGALNALADATGAAKATPLLEAGMAPASLPSGPITPDGIARVIAALLPENAIVIDESVSAGRALGAPTAGAAPHDWLSVMGGSIGWGLPAAVGAAIAAPGRKVLSLEGDGSAMYTIQALWTLAREGLDVTVVIFANRAYQILLGEYAGVGAGTPGPRAGHMLRLDTPALDFVGLARSMGVEAARATDLGSLASELRRGFASSGPYLIEAVL
ncbi:MAG: acetolactate synthase large subunit [Burkholderiaceae bacterium]